MKFLKSTLAIVALLAIVSVDAKVLTKKTQPAVQPIAQPVVTEQTIRNFIDQVFNENNDDMEDIFIDNYNDYGKEGACEFIKNLAQIISSEFPMNIPTAKKLFKERMIEFCNSFVGLFRIEGEKMASIQQCIDNTMNGPSTTIAPVVTPGKETGRGTRRYRRQARSGKVTPK